MLYLSSIVTYRGPSNNRQPWWMVTADSLEELREYADKSLADIRDDYWVYAQVDDEEMRKLMEDPAVKYCNYNVHTDDVLFEVKSRSCYNQLQRESKS